MNYRHSYHAGNFADVVKHLAEVAILAHLAKKVSPFAVIDSHAGRGSYDLASEEALKTGEAASGVQALDGLSGSSLLDRYLSLVSEGSGIYPGSPLIAAKMLRPQDRLVAVEKHPEEAQALGKLLSPWRKARVDLADGYARLAGLLPPLERRGLVLIDPPFESPGEFETLGRAARDALRRFANGIYLIWYPIKSGAVARALEGEVLIDAQKALKVEAAIAAPEGKLSCAALLVLNPPFGFAAQMEEALGRVAPRLKARVQLTWLAGEE